VREAEIAEATRDKEMTTGVQTGGSTTQMNQPGMLRSKPMVGASRVKLRKAVAGVTVTANQSLKVTEVGVVLSRTTVKETHKAKHGDKLIQVYYK
jgi:hypothetical protein